MNLGFLALMVAVLAFAIGNSAMASANFNHGTALICMRCHTMHASEDGSAAGVIPPDFAAAPTGGVTPGGNPKLLLQSGVTDLCLACHGESGSAAGYEGAWLVMSSGTQGVALPGGDYWSANQDQGGRAHNPYYTSAGIESEAIDPDGNYDDPKLPPGASTSLTKWDCGSCHAPHHGDSGARGTASSFRLLWSKPSGLGTPVEIEADGGNLAANESNTNHTAYKGKVSEWCAQCHTDYHNPGSSGLIHPSGKTLSGGTDSFYNLTGYSFIVPVEDSGATTGVFSVTSNSKVMCLSCHRAHGSATNSDEGNDVHVLNITRWDNEVASGAGTGCNKCHGKGE
jgi:hypothetical protein